MSKHIKLIRTKDVVVVVVVIVNVAPGFGNDIHVCTVVPLAPSENARRV